MQVLLFVTIALFFAVANAMGPYVRNNGSMPIVGKINPDTVKELDVPKYLGLWYQMAADEIVYSTFEKDSYCATALYGDNGDGTLSVHNYAAQNSPQGKSSSSSWSLHWITY